MKTPQEAAREYAETLWSRESTLEWEVSRDACKTRSERDFLAGDAFGYRRGMERPIDGSVWGMSCRKIKMMYLCCFAMGGRELALMWVVMNGL